MSLAKKLAAVGLDDRWKASTLALLASHSNVVGGSPFFKPDGTRLFVTDSSTGFPRIKEYAMSSPWDVSTASFASDSFVADYPEAQFFRSDGLKFYLSDASGDLREYDLSTAWDLSSRTLANTFITGNSRYFYFKDDGEFFFTIGSYSPASRYFLSTPWDTSTATLDQTSSALVGDEEGVWFKPDGTKMYTGRGGTGSSAFREYVLSSPWDITSASRNTTTTVVTRGMFYIKPDGSRLYKSGISAFEEYTMG